MVSCQRGSSSRIRSRSQTPRCRDWFLQCVAHLEPKAQASSPCPWRGARRRSLARSHPLGPLAGHLLPAQSGTAYGFSWQVRRGPPAGLPEWGAPLPRKLEAPLRTQDLRCLAPATVSTRLGGLLETSLRWPPICAAISRPLHPPRGYLQSSLGLICGWPGHLSLARFGPQQRTETHDSIARQVLTPLPAAYSSARFCAYPALRFPGLPTALHDIAPMLPVVGCGTRSA